MRNMVLAFGLMVAACLGAVQLPAGFSAGFARSAINPPMGSHIPGYFSDRRASGVLDDSEANVVALADGTNAAVLVSLDLVEVKGLAPKWRTSIAAACGIAPEAVYLACTHTHTAGCVGKAADAYEIGFDSDSAYDAEAEAKVIAACRAALVDLRPAEIRLGRTTCPGISFIRRFRMKDGRATTNPGVNNLDVVSPIGEPDEDVQLVRLVRAEAPEILVVNFQCHPDVIGGTQISADWPGITRRSVEGALGTGVRCAFFNGAQGDTNHVNVRPAPGSETNKGYAHAQHMGRTLAGAVLKAYGRCQPAPAGAIRCAVKDVPMPVRTRDAAELPAAQADWALFKAGRAREIKGPRFRLVEAARIVRLANEPDEVPFPVSAVAIGDTLCFTGLPCEPFTDIGRAVKKGAPFAMTIFTCLTNGSFGYLPTAEGCEGESYESTSTIFAPAAAERVIAAQLDLLRSLAAIPDEMHLVSPNGALDVAVALKDGVLAWTLTQKGKTLIAPSRLGLDFRPAAPLGALRLMGRHASSADVRWENAFAERAQMRDHYNELVVDLEEIEAVVPRVGLGQTTVVKSPRRLSVVFRAYDAGVAFRYVIPEQPAFDGFMLKGELTEWRFAPGTQAWTTSCSKDTPSGETKYAKTALASLVPLDAKRMLGQPVLVETAGSLVALCEAALSNWGGLYYQIAAEKDGTPCLTSYLAKLPDTPAAASGIAVIRQTPAASPWRVAIVGKDELELLRNKDIILNLNPPPDPTIDFSWVKPGPSTWDWWTESNNSLSTELTLKLVDFAAEMGWPYHTIDGGWYGFARRPNHGPDVELKPRKDFDLARIVAHAREKGVGIWVWIHWMEIDDVGIEETFARLEKWGVKGVKTDFLNRADQWIVNWYERVLRAAARHRIMVNFHGAFHPTGTERTWPNNLTREGILGNEMNIFAKVDSPRSITPEHCLTLPFTRYLLGPGDFTPGGFGNVHSRDFVPQCAKGHRYGDETDRCPHWAEQMGTRAFGLAQCVAYDSPLMTLCDWPERYRGAAGIEALRDLPAVWRATTPLDGKCGEHYAVVREAFDGRIYLAALTVKPHTLKTKADFLPPGDWEMTAYVDDPARTPADAKALKIFSRTMHRGERLELDLQEEGGALLVFRRKIP
ncbi:MAG: glycoside hydrolase family 97 catalytic domain-containing protein [Kiritimatiellae bacterium]|nr:glycoside hydrolase family 97 catalytic domain-containing protein [Kiritimatiellia bacterium]